VDLKVKKKEGRKVRTGCFLSRCKRRAKGMKEEGKNESNVKR
jgi:hypothetical protein